MPLRGMGKRIVDRFATDREKKLAHEQVAVPEMITLAKVFNLSLFNDISRLIEDLQAEMRLEISLEYVSSSEVSLIVISATKLDECLVAPIADQQKSLGKYHDSENVDSEHEYVEVEAEDIVDDRMYGS